MASSGGGRLEEVPCGGRGGANASYKRQRSQHGVTETMKVPNRGNSLTMDHGWREVADTALVNRNRKVRHLQEPKSAPSVGVCEPA